MDDNEEKKASVGRPKIEFDEADWDNIKKMCQIFMTKVEIAGMFNCSEDTIEKRIKERYGMNFTAYYKEASAGGKMSLRRSQFKSAVENGNVAMLIWMGKQHLGQSDQPIPEADNEFEYPDP